MKKFVALFMALMLLGSVALADVDLSGMTYDELVALKDQINLAIWESEEWQEVTVPIGVWKIGEDIPAGHWTIKVAPGGEMVWGSISVGTALDETGKDIDIGETEYWYSEMVKLEGEDAAVTLDELDYDFKGGDYLIIEYADMVFTPYAGKPSLGFK